MRQAALREPPAGAERAVSFHRAVDRSGERGRRAILQIKSLYPLPRTAVWVSPGAHLLFRSGLRSRTAGPAVLFSIMKYPHAQVFGGSVCLTKPALASAEPICCIPLMSSTAGSTEQQALPFVGSRRGCLLHYPPVPPVLPASWMSLR